MRNFTLMLTGRTALVEAHHIAESLRGKVIVILVTKSKFSSTTKLKESIYK